MIIGCYHWGKANNIVIQDHYSVEEGEGLAAEVHNYMGGGGGYQ